MHIWTIQKWRKYYNSTHRRGLRFVIDKEVDAEVRQACKDFGVWLRKEFYFPFRVPVYVRAKERIKAMDGELVCGTFFAPENRNHEPYIRIAAGDYAELKQERGKDKALLAILAVIPHELTHYFQWINDIKLTEIGIERQAAAYKNYVMYDYLEYLDNQEAGGT